MGTWGLGGLALQYLVSQLVSEVLAGFDALGPVVEEEVFG